jgi:hypothetical protein
MGEIKSFGVLRLRTSQKNARRFAQDDVSVEGTTYVIRFCPDSSDTTYGVVMETLSKVAVHN